MNKKLFLSALASTALLASCVENDLGSNENISGNGNGDGRISFVQKTGNMTRGTERAENANHYEFGVFAALDGIYDASTPAKVVMNNYLVAFKDASHYTGATGGDTWQTPSGTDPNLTVPENGYSSWFYQDLTSTTSKAEIATQILKYWDLSTDNTDFIAYMPYEKQGATDDLVTYAKDGSSANITFYGLSSFYTDPATDKQVTTAKAGVNTTAHPITVVADLTNNENITNANEALYAHTNVAKADYGKDVPLEFKHVNAKVQVAIYEDIHGYKVHILDLVPTDLSSKGGPSTTSPGVQFTPASQKDATAYVQPTKASTLEGKYYETADVKVTGVNGSTAAITIPDQTTALVNNNTCFASPVGTACGITNHTSKTVIAEATPGTPSNTVHYVLPNHNGDNYIIGNTTNKETVEKTGYTFHVTYEIIPEDGAASTIVYDARVWVAPEYCKWEAGKAYKYIFKITKNSNGTTDPGKVDPADPSTPWIDPDDPRIPDDPALIPIVFDGVVVSDYDDAGDVEGNDHLISDVTTDPNWGVKYPGASSLTYTLSYGRYTETYVKDLTTNYNVYDYTKITTLNSGSWAYNDAKSVFEHTNGTKDATLTATVDVVETLGAAGTITWYYNDGADKNTTDPSTIANSNVIQKVVTTYPSASKAYTATSYIWNDVSTPGAYTANELKTQKTDAHANYTSTVTPAVGTTKATYNSAAKTTTVDWGTVTTPGSWSSVTGPAVAAEHHGSAHVIVIKK